jgi:erythromycin esterase-like protein
MAMMSPLPRFRFRRSLTVASLLGLAAAGCAQASSAPNGPRPATEAAAARAEDRAIDKAAADLCDKDVALLGESDHGDGHTVAFKAELVRRLVIRCRFNAIFFEASHYDLLALARKQRAGERISAEDVAASIGLLWKLDTEMKPLIAWMADEANKKRVYLGGLDDQLGSAGAPYSMDRMPLDMAGLLSPPEREQCADLLARRIRSDFPASSPYSPQKREAIETCLASMRRALAAGAPTPVRDEQAEMVATIARAVSRDFGDDAKYAAARDRSMYSAFHWLSARLQRPRKVIVWAASSHVAKLPAAPGRYQGEPNFGSLLRADYGRRSFALGFSAAGGSYRKSPRSAVTPPVPSAAPDSLERRALAGTAIRYLDERELARLGPSAAGFFFHAPLVLAWSTVFDGAVVFEEERPTGRSN